MKRAAQRLVLIYICIILCGCQDNVISEITSPIPSSSEKTIQDNMSISSPNNISTDDKIDELGDEDFKVNKEDMSIELGMEYKELKTDEQELPANNSLLTSKSVGEYYYKYFSHEYKTFSIVASNQGYVEKGDDFDTYYIVNIVLNDGTYCTNRGIKIGDTRDEILLLYGKDKLIESDQYMRYTLNDKHISFKLSKDDIIEEIILEIITDGDDTFMQEQESVDSIINKNKEEAQNVESNKYVNKEIGFSIDIPKSWDGKYIISEGPFGLRIYHNMNGELGDKIIIIGTYGTKEDWVSNGGGEFIMPYGKLGERNNLIFTYQLTSESSYNDETEEGKKNMQEYQEMMNDISSLIDSFTFLNDDYSLIDEIWYKKKMQDLQK